MIDQQNWALNRRHWQQIADHLRQGQTLTQAIANQPIITDLAKQLIATGESSGQLPAMLTKIAQHHETEFTQRLQRFTQLLEPLSLVVIGGMVTLMMLALYIPLFELGNTL